MRPRVAEIRAVTALLDQEWTDVEDLASAVLEKAIDMLTSRELWVVIGQDQRLGTFVCGPYDTRTQATKAIGRRLLPLVLNLCER